MSPLDGGCFTKIILRLQWYHRITTSGAPVIRARTHNSGPYVDHALYFEDEVSGNSDANTFRSDNGGIYVYVEYAKPAVPIAVNKMIINNADDSDVGRIEALQYTRLVATDDDRVKADSNMIKLPTIGWNPAGLVESGPSYTSYISAAIYFVRGRHLAWCPTNVKMQLEWN